VKKNRQFPDLPGFLIKIIIKIKLCSTRLLPNTIPKFDILPALMAGFIHGT
jgi:hypothetical protein